MEQLKKETNPFDIDTLWKKYGKVDLHYWNRLLEEADDKVKQLNAVPVDHVLSPYGVRVRVRKQLSY